MASTSRPQVAIAQNGVYILAKIPGYGIFHAAGPTVPTDGDSGYAPGAVFHHLDGGEDTAVYVNDGSKASCDFNTIPSAVTATSSELNTVADGILATAAEVNRVCDLSTKIVDATAATLTVTLATHADKIITLNRAAGIAVTLPAATGTGAKFTFFIGTAITSNTTTIKVANATDEYRGIALGADDDAEGATGYTWKADDDDDTITMSGTATGGKLGDYWEITDVATGLFLVKGHLKQSGGSEATPFSATVS